MSTEVRLSSEGVRPYSSFWDKVSLWSLYMPIITVIQAKAGIISPQSVHKDSPSKFLTGSNIQEI